MTLTYAHIEELFHRYRAELTRRLLTMVSSHDAAADLLQDTYVRLLRFARMQPVEQPRALLHRIAKNLAIDYLRTKRGGLHDMEALEVALDAPCPVPSQERVLLAKERLRLLTQAVEALPPRTKEAFLLYRFSGCSYREIADRMGISISGVDKHIRRAIEQTYAAVKAFDAAE